MLDYGRGTIEARLKSRGQTNKEQADTALISLSLSRFQNYQRKTELFTEFISN
jgi:hypothetical protein